MYVTIKIANHFSAISVLRVVYHAIHSTLSGSTDALYSICTPSPDLDYSVSPAFSTSLSLFSDPLRLTIFRFESQAGIRLCNT